MPRLYLPRAPYYLFVYNFPKTVVVFFWHGRQLRATAYAFTFHISYGHCMKGFKNRPVQSRGGLHGNRMEIMWSSCSLCNHSEIAHISHGTRVASLQAYSGYVIIVYFQTFMFQTCTVSLFNYDDTSNARITKCSMRQRHLLTQTLTHCKAAAQS